MKIEVLHTVSLHKNLMEYREAVESDLIAYCPGFYECNDKYRERFERVDAFIRIIEEEVEVVEEEIKEEKVKETPSKPKGKKK